MTNCLLLSDVKLLFELKNPMSMLPNAFNFLAETNALSFDHSVRNLLSIRQSTGTNTSAISKTHCTARVATAKRTRGTLSDSPSCAALKDTRRICIALNGQNKNSSCSPDLKTVPCASGVRNRGLGEFKHLGLNICDRSQGQRKSGSVRSTSGHGTQVTEGCVC